MATIYPRKKEMDVTYIPATPPEGAAYRFSADGFLQLKDSATADQFRSAFLTSGALVAGPAED